MNEDCFWRAKLEKIKKEKVSHHMIETHLFIHLFLHWVDCVDYTLFVVCYPFSNIKTVKTVGFNLKL